MASEELVTDWNNKRLNAGDINSQFLVSLSFGKIVIAVVPWMKFYIHFFFCFWKYKASGQQQSYQGFEQAVGSSYDQTLGMYAKYSCGKLLPAPIMQVNTQSAQQRTVPILLGKG